MYQTHIQGVKLNPVIIKILAVMGTGTLTTNWDISPNEMMVNGEEGVSGHRWKGTVQHRDPTNRTCGCRGCYTPSEDRPREAETSKAVGCYKWDASSVAFSFGFVGKSFQSPFGKG